MRNFFLVGAFALGGAFALLASSERTSEAKPARRAVRDPLLAAIVQHESHGVASVVGGRDNQCIGLTQICLHDFAVCKGEEGFDAPACLAKKTSLLNPGENLRVAASQLDGWRKHCKKTVGRSDVRAIVFGFSGADGRGIHCGMRRGKRGWVLAKTPKVVREILDIYAEKKRGR